MAKATLVTLTGNAVIVGADGSPRVAKVCDVIHKGETLRTAAGARVELLMEDDQILAMGPAQAVRIDETLVQTDATPTTAEAAVQPTTVEQVTQILQQGGDPTQELEAAAAGAAGGAGGEGSSFVRLLRITEGVDPLAYDYRFEPEGPIDAPLLAAEAPVPTEPPATEPPVTEPPVTQPPATEPPVTEPPVTEPPVTQPPATEPPVTEPPVTEPPVTQPPATEPPATEPPVTQPPATEPPVTQPPATEPPVTEPPVTEPPVTQPPATEPPVTQPPATEPPVTQPPATEPPVTQPPATEPPVTEPPVTEPPVTQPPATEPPVTQPPATEPPVTEPPVTEPPVTQPPATEPPVTEPPVTEPPVTQPPATEPPVTEPPVTEPPVTQPPATEPPVTEPPVTEPPVTQPPATEPPATEPPVTQPPATEPPVTEPPVTEPPVTQPPATEPPVTQPPATEPPVTQPPATEPPVTQPPATEPPVTQPPATEPPVTEPPVTEPPVTQPPATEPPVTQPPATEPPVTEPPVTEPPVTQPPATEPPVTEPPVTEPPVTQPPATEPPVTEPPVTEPPVTQPPATEPPVTEPPVTEPPVTQPPATEPPVTEPPVTEPPVTEPPVTEPPVTQPSATEPPVTQPPATEPPVTQPPATEPPVTQPPATEPPVTQPPATEPPVVLLTITGGAGTVRESSIKEGVIHWGADTFGGVVKAMVGGQDYGPADGVITVRFGLDGKALSPDSTADVGAILTIQATGEDAGKYTLEVVGALQHATATHTNLTGLDEAARNAAMQAAEDWLDLSTITLVGQDKDGDPIQVDLTARVQDDVPEVLVNAPSTGLVPTFTVEYKGGEAGYNNSFGFYVKQADGTPQAGVVLFDSVKHTDAASGSVTVTIGSSTYTFDVTNVGTKGYQVSLPDGLSPDQIGFFLIPNGDNKNATLDDRTPVTFEKVGSEWVAKAGSTVLNGDGAKVYFSDQALNTDGQSHVQATPSGTSAGQTSKGNFNWEDLEIITSSSDKYYDDVNLTIQWSGVPLLVKDAEADTGTSTDTDHDPGETQFSSRFQFNFGADGPAATGSKVFGLSVLGTTSSLKDSATGQTVAVKTGVDGEAIGYVTIDGNEVPVFQLAVDASTGVLTVDLYRAVVHPTNDPHEITNLGDGVIALTATAKDGDGDTASNQFDIGRAINFQDSGPVAADDTLTLIATEANKSINVLVNDQYEGKGDGALAEVVWNRAGGDRTYNATDFFDTVGETTLDANGILGKLAIEKAGDATYTLDTVKAMALAEGAKLNDIFNYQMKDADGDTDVANLTVTVTGVNDRLEFVTGKDTIQELWIDKNGNGKQDAGETSKYSAENTDSLSLVVQEDALSNGNKEGAGQNDVDTRTFGVADPDIGDVPVVYFSTAELPSLTSGGVAVKWSWSGDTPNAIVGKVGDTTILTVSISGDYASGYSAKVDIDGPIDHARPGFGVSTNDDTVNLAFQVIANDRPSALSTGLTDTMTLNVSIEDDAPVVKLVDGQNVTIDVRLEEESVPGLKGNQETESPDLSDTTGVKTMTGTVNWGADGFGKVTAVTFGSTTVSVGPAGATVYFDQDGKATTDASKAAATMQIAENGDYTVTVTGALKHTEQGEDWLKLDPLNLVAEDKDGDTVTVALTAQVQDDVPVAHGAQNVLIANVSPTVNTVPPVTNMIVTLDVSGSMSGAKLASAKAALDALIEQYQNSGGVNVQFTTFSTNAQSTAWMDAAEAKAFLGTLSANGYTNYEAAIHHTIRGDGPDSGTGTDPRPAADQTVAYFITDGAPNREYSWTGLVDPQSNPSVINVSGDAVDANYVEAWKGFVGSTVDHLFVVAVETPVSDQDLVRLIDGVTTAKGDNGQVKIVEVSKHDDLLHLLQETVIVTPPQPVTATASLGIDPGADGWGKDAGIQDVPTKDDGSPTIRYVTAVAGNGDATIVTSGGTKLVYEDDGSGGLKAVKETSGEVVFTVSLDRDSSGLPTGTYSVTMLGQVDAYTVTEETTTGPTTNTTTTSATGLLHTITTQDSLTFTGGDNKGGGGSDTLDLGTSEDVVAINLSDTSTGDKDVVKSFGSDGKIPIQDVLPEDSAPLTVTETQTGADVTLSVDSNGTATGGIQQQVVIESATTAAVQIAIDTSLMPDLATITKTGHLIFESATTAAVQIAIDTSLTPDLATITKTGHLI
jgi:hypothetical protein